LYSGYFALAGGKSTQTWIYSPKVPDCIYPCRSKGQAHEWCCFQWLHFGENVKPRLRAFIEVTLRLSGSDSREPPGYGHLFAISRPMAASHRKSGDIGLSAKGKGKSIREKKFIYRNGEAA
jgi:hypothetical protein